MSLDLDALDQPLAQASGAPLLLPIDAIDEDPDQPRKEFDAAALDELAETIRQRGVRQPVSVRTNRTQPGRWVLNFGARRLRAAALAGCASIPAFVDETADSYDQVIENEQREALKPLELALFVQRRLAAGESQAEIARRIGKSRQYVMTATALVDAPDWLMDVYRTGRCRGLTELHELRRLHAQHPQQVETWVSEREAITREQLQGLRAALANGTSTGGTASAAGRKQVPEKQDGNGDTSRNTSSSALTTSRRCQQRKLLARLDGSVVSIVTDTPPATAGCVFIESDEAPRVEVEAARLILLGFSTQ